VIDLHPKAVVILAGTGDTLGNGGDITVENIFGNLVSMCELARANNIAPVLCCLLPTSKGGSPNLKVPQLNKLIKDYAEKSQTPCVDYFSAIADKDNGMPKNLSEDSVHPNAEGNRIMESLVLPVIEEIK
jgi:lysophospholipase L1-like esterase